MSERVSRIIFKKSDSNSREELFSKVAQQLSLLLQSGYNCFITNADAKGDTLCIEFCLADPTAKNREIPQPCWLFLDELEQLSKYQLEQILEEARKTIEDIETEESEEDDDPSIIKDKKPKNEA